MKVGDSPLVEGMAMASQARSPPMVERFCDYEGRVEFRVPVNRRAIFAALVFVAIVTTVGVAALTTGTLADFYEWLWMSTTGEPYTDLMRDHVWVYPTAAAAVVIPAALLLPRQYWVRVVLLYATFWTGFVGGHVLWQG